MRGEWITWEGGPHCPVPYGADTEVKFSDGSTEVDCWPEGWCWEKGGGIVAYRLVQPVGKSEQGSVSAAQPTKHSHYHKDVSHLKIIDVYRVIELWELDSPPLQHALKKILVAGGRGHKDIDKDIQEAIHSLERWKEMRKEDNNVAN